MLEHKIQINLQKLYNQFKEEDNKVIHYKEHRDHNNNQEQDQRQVHNVLIINNRTLW